MCPNELSISRTNGPPCRLSRFTLLVGLAFGVLGLVTTVQADVIFSESFETDGQGTRYTASQPFNVSQSSNGAYWDRGDNDDFNTLIPYTNPHGTFFWAAESVDWVSPGPGGNGNEVQTIDFGPFNIEGFTDLQFSGLFASTATALGAGFPFDLGQGIRVKYSVDGGLFLDELCFAPVDWPDLRNLGHDTDCDGSGESTVLTDEFAAFGFGIPDGATLEIHIEVKAPGSSQEVALDLFQVSGDFASITGDFDLDGDVDGFDFLKWQRSEVSNPPSAEDLADWQENFGIVASSMTPASAAVPEPTTGILLMLGMAALLTSGRTLVSIPNCA